jgi:hypothetical protein
MDLSGPGIDVKLKERKKVTTPGPTKNNYFILSRFWTNREMSEFIHP